MENYEVLEELHNVEAEIEDVQGAFFSSIFLRNHNNNPNVNAISKLAD